MGKIPIPQGDSSHTPDDNRFKRGGVVCKALWSDSLLTGGRLVGRAYSRPGRAGVKETSAPTTYCRIRSWYRVNRPTDTIHDNPVNSRMGEVHCRSRRNGFRLMSGRLRTVPHLRDHPPEDHDRRLGCIRLQPWIGADLVSKDGEVSDREFLCHRPNQHFRAQLELPLASCSSTGPRGPMTPGTTCHALRR